MQTFEPITLKNFPSLYRQAVANSWRGDRGISKLRLVKSLLGGVFPARLQGPLFVIGSPRSGTTFLGDCLGEVKGVRYFHEPAVLKRAVKHVYLEEWSEKFSKNFYYYVFRSLAKYYRANDQLLVDKTPSNCLIVPFLAQVFPHSKFLFIVRDGRDCALSHMKKPWLQASMRDSGKREPGGYLYGPWCRFWVEPDRHKEFESADDFHRCAWNWRRFNEHALSGLKSISCDRIFRIKYENLVSEPSKYAREILNFIEVVYQGQGNFNKKICSATSSSIQNWTNELSEKQIIEFEREAGKVNRSLGYD